MKPGMTVQEEILAILKGAILPEAYPGFLERPIPVFGGRSWADILSLEDEDTLRKRLSYLEDLSGRLEDRDMKEKM